MKKLMIATAIAAITVGAFADNAQVYEATLTVKTTQCRKATVSAAMARYLNNLLGAGTAEARDSINLRKQASMKIAGLFWGCNCDTIAVPRPHRLRPRTAVSNGRALGFWAFWNQTGNYFYLLWPYTTFKWNVLNKIDTFNKIEGSWTLANRIAEQALRLNGAGFGTIHQNGTRPCEEYITSISGNFAGYRIPGASEVIEDDCPLCNSGSNCTVLQWCEACSAVAPADTRAMTVAYGTWTIKYNSAASKRYGTQLRITRSYTFKRAGNLATVLAGLEDFVDTLDRLGLDSSNESDMTASEVKTALAYTALKSEGYKVDKDSGELVDSDGVAVDVDAVEDSVLAEFGYTTIENADFGDWDVPSVAIEDILDAFSDDES